MQDYGNPASRNPSTAAGKPAPGAGAIPGKVSVPLPGTDANQKPYNGGSAKAPAGFNGGIIPGKI